MRRALVLLVAALLCACGPSEPPVRLRPAVGADLVYEAHRRDDWQDPQFGFGGVLDTVSRLRMQCVERVSGRGATYEVLVESLRVDAPERFGVVMDTLTPDTESGDRHGAEEVARSLLRRRGRLVLAESGGAGAVEPDQDLRARLKEWSAQRERKAAQPVMLLLDEVLDAPRVVARWMQAAALLLPPEEDPEVGATWTRRAPPFASPAGEVVVELTITYVPGPEEGHCRLSATGTCSVPEPPPDAPLTFESGTFESWVDFDRRRGIVLRYGERSAYFFRKDETPEGLVPVIWERDLTLLEE